MSINSISGSQSASAGIWAQLQQQQAQRTADQAETKARALKSQADQAATVADQAVENARSVKVESRLAEGDFREARMNLASLESLSALQDGFSRLRSDLATVSGNAGADAVAAPTTSSQPVVNAQGQTTGTLLSVTA